MNIYIDFFSALPQKGGVKFHGGGGYTRNIIKAISEYIDDYVKIILMCPESFVFCEETEPELFKLNNIECINIKHVSDFEDFKEDDIVFYPMLGYLYELKEIVEIRKNNPNIKLCATLHDIRFLEYTSDRTERYYEKGIKKFFFPIYSYTINNLLKKAVKKPALKKCLKALDEVYTVSNYSMQQILKQNNRINISWYYQTVMPRKVDNIPKLMNEEYILFVSGARPVKNLTHALIGFSKYKEKNENKNIKLVVTGINEEQFSRLCTMPQIDTEIVVNNTVIFGYVSNEQLASLYTNSRFVLYTSKNEGFGLPILEAAAYGKTCVSSNIASIPEVLGSAVRYVSPIDDVAIAREIEFLCNDSNLDVYEKRVNRGFEILELRMKQELENFLEDLIHL